MTPDQIQPALFEHWNEVDGLSETYELSERINRCAGQRVFTHPRLHGAEPSSCRRPGARAYHTGGTNYDRRLDLYNALLALTVPLAQIIPTAHPTCRGIRSGRGVGRSHGRHLRISARLIGLE